MLKLKERLGFSKQLMRVRYVCVTVVHSDYTKLIPRTMIDWRKSRIGKIVNKILTWRTEQSRAAYRIPEVVFNLKRFFLYLYKNPYQKNK